jgi:hypothetical protein
MSCKWTFSALVHLVVTKSLLTEQSQSMASNGSAARETLQGEALGTSQAYQPEGAVVVEEDCCCYCLQGTES